MLELFVLGDYVLGSGREARVVRVFHGLRRFVYIVAIVAATSSLLIASSNCDLETDWNSCKCYLDRCPGVGGDISIFLCSSMVAIDSLTAAMVAIARA